ncbi:MAG: hypothetical protein ACHQIL_00085 [Steroidobacterales bacterium]
MDYELKQRLDAFVRGESGETAFIEELCAVCAATPGFTWDVLAVTDQYHRRGKISADLSRTIRYAIARPAVARQVTGCAEPAPMASIAPIAPMAPTAPMAPVAPVAAPDELQALRCELHASLRKLSRYRTRLAKLAAFGHRHRHALAEVRRELESSRVHALAPFVPGPRAALDLAALDRDAVSVGADRDGTRPTSRWVWPSQLAAALALFLTVTASSALRQAPIARVAPTMAAPVKAASALGAAPARPAVQHLSLDSERYVIRPGDRLALIRVQRTGGSTGKVSFTWWTRPSGAKSGADYRGQLPSAEQLPEGVDAVTLSVPIIANPLRAHTELFYVAIGHPDGGAVIGAIRTSVVIIMPSS